MCQAIGMVLQQTLSLYSRSTDAHTHVKVISCESAWRGRVDSQYDCSPLRYQREKQHMKLPLVLCLCLLCFFYDRLFCCVRPFHVFCETSIASHVQSCRFFCARMPAIQYSTVWLHFKWALSETDRKSPNALYVAIGCVVEDQQQALPPQAPRA